jgi:hypothetical protein
VLIWPTWQHSSGRKAAWFPGVAICKLHGKLHQHSIQGLCLGGCGLAQVERGGEGSVRSTRVAL